MSAPEPLPWPMIPGSPMDFASAKINLAQAQLTGQHYETAWNEYVAAQKRYTERECRLAARREATIRSTPALSGAEHELAYYGGAL